jgi:hypothetical protein
LIAAQAFAVHTWALASSCRIAKSLAQLLTWRIKDTNWAEIRLINYC